MILSDLLSTHEPSGRALLRDPGYPASFLLPNRLRDYHEMPRWQRRIVGTLTPAMTWRNGVAVNLVAMPLEGGTGP